MDELPDRSNVKIESITELLERCDKFVEKVSSCKPRADGRCKTPDHWCPDWCKKSVEKTTEVGKSCSPTGYVTTWKDADVKPEEGQVVLIHVHSLGDYGIASAWWCEEDYRWIALDDMVQFDEDMVDWWCDLIQLPLVT